MESLARLFSQVQAGQGEETSEIAFTDVHANEVTSRLFQPHDTEIPDMHTDNFEDIDVNVQGKSHSCTVEILYTSSFASCTVKVLQIISSDESFAKPELQISNSKQVLS